MQLINPAILYGLGLAVVPVVLHLLLRARPKPFVFPALQLLEVRRRHNVRRLRLRHLWLLLLRIVLIALVVLAVARLKLPAANFWPRWPGEMLVLLVLFALPLVVYLLLLRAWRRRGWPQHQYTTRRTILRGGVGLLVAVLLALWGGLLYAPRVAGEMSNPSQVAARNAPVAAVFIFDTSLSMDYRTQSKTRLETAQQIAREHLARLPLGSEVAVIDTRIDPSVVVDDGDATDQQVSSRWVLFLTSPSAVLRRIDELATHPVRRSLNTCVESALSLLEPDTQRSSREIEEALVREIYVFTDVARSGWSLDEDNSARLREAVGRNDWLGGVYVVDVGVTRPVNAGIESVDLSHHTVPIGGAVSVTAAVNAVGATEKETRTVDLFLVNKTGKKVPRGSMEVTLEKGNTTTVTFLADGLSGPFVQGEVRLRSSDPLDVDDAGYFTIGVAPAPEILLVAPTVAETDYLREALSPSQEQQRGQARFRCSFLASNRLADAGLDRYRAVILLNAAKPASGTWQRLEEFVRGGGGLGVVLGSSMHWQAGGVDPAAYNSDAAHKLLPAELDVSWKYAPPEYLDLRNATHPALKLFADLGSSGDLANRGISRYWKLKPLAGSRVIARFTGEAASPALVERALERGRVLVLATALDLRWQWNDLARSGWYVVLVDQLVGYLSGRTSERFTHRASIGSAIQLFPPRPVLEYSVVNPGGGQQPGRSRSGRVLSIDADGGLGHYQVQSLQEGDDYRAGFSLNLDAEERTLDRLATEELDGLFGEKRYSLSRDLEQLERNVGNVRIGREVFPSLLFLLLLVFCVEHLVANKFYDVDQSETAGDTAG